MKNFELESGVNIPEIEFPDGLSETDKELVVRQCELQHATSKEEVEGFASAYSSFKELSDDEEKILEMSAEKFLEYIKSLATQIDKVNTNGWSKVPRMFGPDPTNKGVDPENIQRAMEGWAEAFVENRLEPDEAYEMFERIHPLNDGNGRLGDLLWKFAMKRKTGEWPDTLPPDMFGDKE